MAAPAWPGTVPTSCDIVTLQEMDQDELVRWKPEYGLEKLRRRTSMVIATIKYQRTMTLVAWDALQSFYRLSCQNGALAFTGTHPRTGAAISAQWTAMPTMRTMGSHTVCIVAIEYAVLPVNAA